MNCCVRTFLFEHSQNVLRGAITEQLSQGLFVIRNVMLLHQRDKIGRRIAGQRGFCKVRICRNKVFRRAMEIGEVTASAAGNENFLALTLSTFEHGNAPSPAARFNRTHESGCSSAKNQGVVFLNVRSHRPHKIYRARNMVRTYIGEPMFGGESFSGASGVTETIRSQPPQLPLGCATTRYVGSPAAA